MLGTCSYCREVQAAYAVHSTLCYSMWWSASAYAGMSNLLKEPGCLQGQVSQACHSILCAAPLFTHCSEVGATSLREERVCQCSVGAYCEAMLFELALRQGGVLSCHME